MELDDILDSDAESLGAGGRLSKFSFLAKFSYFSVCPESDLRDGWMEFDDILDSDGESLGTGTRQSICRLGSGSVSEKLYFNEKVNKCAFSYTRPASRTNSR